MYNADGTTTDTPVRELTDTEVETRAREVQRKRGEKCMAAIQEVLKQHRCRVRIEVLIAGESVPLESVLAFPAKIGILTD